MPTNPNMVAIQTVTVGSGGAANITFSNIPQTYTDLNVVLSARGTDNSGRLGLYITLNDSTSSIYSSRRLQAYDANQVLSASDTNVAPTANSSFGRVNGNNTTANSFGSTQIYIPNYTGSSNKSMSVDWVVETNSSTTDWTNGFSAALWGSTSAITKLALSLEAGNFAQYSTATLYGVTSAGYGAKATGGIITETADYYIHTFLASGTFTPTTNLTNVDYLVVAGGGGGGRSNSGGGGGGAGGLRSTVTNTGGGGSLESKISLNSGTNYTITVGAGGAISVNDGGVASNGGNSSISGSGLTTITSTGGGGGAGGGTNGASGGSGGGTGYHNAQQTGGTGTANQGYAGGNNRPSAPNYESAGGGGAGQAGANAASGVNGKGGDGVAVSITGSSVTYAGGGGSGSGGGTVGAGGAGGGGAGANGAQATAGTANTGGGGGGGQPSGTGGSGIVIIRYAK